MRAFGAHACFLDRQCRALGAPRRLYLHSPWGSLIIGVARDDWTQAWFPGVGYTRLFLPVVWQPADGGRR